MKIIKNIEPKTPPISWNEFLLYTLPCSISIDGFVNDSVQWEASGKRLNLDHHTNCDRLTTRSTASQAAMLIRSGLMESYKNEPYIHLYMNDCDEDVILTNWIFENYDIVGRIENPAFNRILHIEDMLDTTAGMYGFDPDLPGIRECNWIFEPYKVARMNGIITNGDSTEFKKIIDESCARIDLAITGRGHVLDLDTRYEVIHEEHGWSMINEIGVNSRIGLAKDGIKAFVSVKDRGNGKYSYSIGRQSIFVPFDIPKILNALNLVEDSKNGSWGGSNTIGGSPRSYGSSINPFKLIKIVNSIVKPE